MQIKLSQYRELLQQRAEAQKRQLDIEVEIRVFEKQMELMATMANQADSVVESETEQFIDRYRDKLEPEDLEFLAAEYRGTAEVADHTAMSKNTIIRRADAGFIRCRRIANGQRQFSTVSVLEFLLNAEAEEET